MSSCLDSVPSLKEAYENAVKKGASHGEASRTIIAKEFKRITEEANKTRVANGFSETNFKVPKVDKEKINDAKTRKQNLQKERESLYALPKKPELTKKERKVKDNIIATEEEQATVADDTKLDLIGSSSGARWFKKWFTSGDKTAVSQKEKTDATKEDAKRKVETQSRKILKTVEKLQSKMTLDKSGKSAKTLANVVLSKGKIDTKLSKSLVISDAKALSIASNNLYTEKQIQEAVEDVQNKDSQTIEQSAKVLKDVAAYKKEQINQIKEKFKQEIDGMAYALVNFPATINKTAVDVVNKDGKTESKWFTKKELIAEINKKTGSENITKEIAVSKEQVKQAQDKLLKTVEGQRVLSAISQAREQIDDFSDWVRHSEASMNIKDTEFARQVVAKSGFHLQRVYDFWKKEDFKIDDVILEQATKDVQDTFIMHKVRRFANTKTFDELTDEQKSKKLDEIIAKAKKDAFLEVQNYVLEKTNQKQSKEDFPRAGGKDKVNSNTFERDAIEESFLKILGSVEDPILQYHETMITQSKIRSAATLHYLLDQTLGDSAMFDSVDEAILHHKKEHGFNAGEYVAKNYTEVKDSKSVINGKVVHKDIIDSLYDVGSTTNKDGFYQGYFKALGLWNTAKTVYRPAGHITNYIGGRLWQISQGVVIPKGAITAMKDMFRDNKGNISKEGKKFKEMMILHGGWNANIDIASINMMIDLHEALDLGDKSKIESIGNKIKKANTDIKRFYGVTDDYTKMVFVMNKIDVTSRKITGKKYSDLTPSSEMNKVHAAVIERAKQNGMTMSRLPKFAKKMLRLPFGNFISFSYASLNAYTNTWTNMALDLRNSTNSKLTKEQRSAFREDGLKTASGLATTGAINWTLGNYLASAVAVGITMAKNFIFDEEKEDDRFKNTEQGNLVELFIELKNTNLVVPWMKGKNVVVYGHDKNGEVTVTNLSQKFPDDEFSSLIFGRQGQTQGETLINFVKDKIKLNGLIEKTIEVQKNKDFYGEEIYTSDDSFLESIAYSAWHIGKDFLPAQDIIKVGTDANSDAKDEIAEKPKKGKDDRVAPWGLIAEKVVNRSTDLINKNYKVNFEKNLSGAIRSAYDSMDKFSDLTESKKADRLRFLGQFRKDYLWLEKYGTFIGDENIANRAINKAKESTSGKMSKDELLFIKTGVYDK